MNTPTSVEVTSFIKGEPSLSKTMSPARERREARLAALIATGAVFGALALVLAVAKGQRLVLLAPLVLGAWTAAAVAAAVWAARRARHRASRFAVGTELSCDAFASATLDLVARRGGHYEIALIPGMTGTIENGRAPMPVEALTQAGPVRVELPHDGRAQIDLGPNAFVVRWRSEAKAPVAAWRQVARQGARFALVPAAAAAMVTLFSAVPAAASFTERDMLSAIPPDATPWQAEKFLRLEAQAQSHALHQCFDPLPLECQTAGYVAIGMKLTKEGEVMSRWIARSSYKGACDPTACMADVAATFFFEPLPEPMTIVLPVQVLRTNRSILTVSPALETEGTP